MVQSRHPEVDDPRRAETDEESLVLSGHGLQHGRLKVLNSKVKHSLTTSFTRLKAVLTLVIQLAGRNLQQYAVYRSAELAHEIDIAVIIHGKYCCRADVASNFAFRKFPVGQLIGEMINVKNDSVEDMLRRYVLLKNMGIVKVFHAKSS